jgi:hypothetical protein
MNKTSLSEVSTELHNLIQAEEAAIREMLLHYAPQDCYYELISRVQKRANVIAQEYGYKDALSLLAEIEKHTSNKYIRFSDFGRFAIRLQTKLA